MKREIRPKKHGNKRQILQRLVGSFLWKVGGVSIFTDGTAKRKRPMESFSVSTPLLSSVKVLTKSCTTSLKYSKNMPHTGKTNKIRLEFNLHKSEYFVDRNQLHALLCHLISICCKPFRFFFKRNIYYSIYKVIGNYLIQFHEFPELLAFE